MYFKNIQNITIDVDGSGNFDRLKNLTAKAKVSDELINNAGFYQTIEIIDGEIGFRTDRMGHWASIFRELVGSKNVDILDSL